MIAIERNPRSNAFLGPLPNEAALCVIKHFSGTSLFRLREVDYRAYALVIDLMHSAKFWRGLGFVPGNEPDQFQVDRAISVAQRVGRMPTILDLPPNASLSWRILTRLNIASRDASINPKAVAERAARLGDVDLCKVALHSASPITKSKCMSKAIRGRHLRIVELLLDLDAPASFDHFRLSVWLGEITIAERLAAHNSDLYSRISPLQSAALRGKTDEFEEIEINDGEWEGFHHLPGPLHLAALRGDTEAITRLYELGCPVEVVDKHSGQVAIHYAAEKGYTEAIVKLHELGCHVDTKGKNYGQRALHYAAEMGHTDAIVKLKALGCDINAKDSYGQTAVHYAAKHGHTEAITELHELGCRIDVKGNNYGQTALHFAAENGHAETITELRRLGCPIDLDNYYGQTALHKAAIYGHMGAATELIRLGCSIDLTDIYGQTPLRNAVMYGHMDVAKVLECPETSL